VEEILFAQVYLIANEVKNSWFIAILIDKHGGEVQKF
jgi:hypothetical protein